MIAVGFYAVFTHVQETNLKHVQSNFCIRNNLDKNKFVRVIREGEYKIINSEQLVIGDIVHLEHSNYKSSYTVQFLNRNNFKIK